MTDVYLTSTFTNPWNVSFNPRIGEALEKAGLVCYLPHRDTNQKAEHKDIFASDLGGIKQAKCLLAVAMNETPNWGAELGYAYTLNKPTVVLTTKDHTIPLICNGMVTEVVRVEDLDKIESYISNLVKFLQKYL